MNTFTSIFGKCDLDFQFAKTLIKHYENKQKEKYVVSLKVPILIHVDKQCISIFVANVYTFVYTLLCAGVYRPERIQYIRCGHNILHAHMIYILISLI